MNKDEALTGPVSEADPMQGSKESSMIIPQITRSVDPLCAPDGWVLDQCLDAFQRAVLAEFAAPRVGLDGSTVWPADEVWP